MPLGRLTIRPEALMDIVAWTMSQMEGVRLWRPRGLSRVLGGEGGVVLESPQPGVLDVHVKIAVMYGYPVHELAQGVQQAVREALAELAGVEARAVNIYVQEVFLPEIEEGENGS